MGTGYFRLPISSGSVEPPSIGPQSVFTGATVPLSYKDNTHEYENTYEYASTTHNITIAGLTGRATITGNGSKAVTVVFDVTSAESTLAGFTITCTKTGDTQVFRGLHAHYGIATTGILVFAFDNIPADPEDAGIIGLNYRFIVSTPSIPPTFSGSAALWSGYSGGDIFSYQVLNVLLGNLTVTTLPSSYLGYAYSFNQPVKIPPTVTALGSYVLNTCIAFNQPITIPSTVGQIGDRFMNNCTAFNQKVVIEAGSIASNFMFGCSAFNSELSLKSTMTSVGTYFMSNCSAFNQRLVLPEGVTSISDSFMNGCWAFNSEVVLPSGLIALGNNFMAICYAFNKKITFPSTLTEIASAFLSNCYAFNQPLSLTGITTISSGFMQMCKSFNQPIEIPVSVTSIVSVFYQAESLSTIIWNTATMPSGTAAQLNQCLAQTTNSKPHVTYGSGIKVLGTYAAQLKAALPNRTASPYRKLV